MPGFPVWASVQAPIRNHEYFKRFAAHSIEVPGPEVQQLCDAAREHGIIRLDRHQRAHHRHRSAASGTRTC